MDSSDETAVVGIPGVCRFPTANPMEAAAKRAQQQQQPGGPATLRVRKNSDGPHAAGRSLSNSVSAILGLTMGRNGQPREQYHQMDLEGFPLQVFPRGSPHSPLSLRGPELALATGAAALSAPGGGGSAAAALQQASQAPPGSPTTARKTAEGAPRNATHLPEPLAAMPRNSTSDFFNEASAVAALREEGGGPLRIRRKKCTVVLVDGAFAHLVDGWKVTEAVAEHEAVLARLAQEWGGVVENFRDPESILVSFNAHTPCLLHEQRAVDFAVAVRAETSSAVVCVVDSGHCFVGGRVRDFAVAHEGPLFGGPVHVAARLVPLMRRCFGTRLVVTERTAKGLSSTAFYPSDVVALGGSSVGNEGCSPATVIAVAAAGGPPQHGRPFVLYEVPTVDDALGLLLADDIGGAPFRTAFELLCQGRGIEALAAFEALTAAVVSSGGDARLSRLTAAAKAVARSGHPYTRAEAVPWDPLGSTASESSLVGGLTPMVVATQPASTPSPTHYNSHHPLGGGPIAVHQGSQHGRAVTPARDQSRQAVKELLGLSREVTMDEDALFPLAIAMDEGNGLNRAAPPPLQPAVEGGPLQRTGSSHSRASNPLEPPPGGLLPPGTPHLEHRWGAGQEDNGDLPVTLTDTNGMQWTRAKKPFAHGAIGTVYQVMGPTGTLCALKVFRLTEMRVDIDRLVEEALVISTLRHENIVSQVSYVRTGDYFSIVTEFLAGGSLRTLLDNYGRIQPSIAERFLVEMLQGLNFLHRSGVVHCDIKPHNVLMGTEGQVKLADFGSCINTLAVAPPGASSAASGVEALRGTCWYMAPEVAAGMEPTAKSDMWSLAVTTIEMITGVLPWPKMNQFQFIRNLPTDESMMPSLEGVDTVATPAIKLLLLHCLRRAPSERPTASEMLSRIAAVTTYSNARQARGLGSSGRQADGEEVGFVL